MSKQISSKRRAMVYERDGRQCQYCGKPKAKVLMERGIDLKLKPAHVFFFEQKEVEQ